MAEKNLYEILGVEPESSPDEIKRAYRKLARLYHPDSAQGGASEELFQKVTQAYDILSNPEKRKQYDEIHIIISAARHREKMDAYKRAGEGTGKRTETMERSRDPERERQTRVFERLREQVGEFDERTAAHRMGDEKRNQGPSLLGKLTERFHRPTTKDGRKESGSIFKKVSDTFIKQNGGKGTAEQNRSLFGDREYQFTIDALESITGTSREIGLEGGESPRVFRVKIPAGVQDGAVINLTAPAKDEQPTQRLRVRINVTPHPLVERDGYDIIVKIPITVGEAINGVDLSVPSLDGPVSIKIPPGWDIDKRLRVRGKGVVNPSNPDGEPGNMYVKTYVVLPEQPSELLSDIARKIDSLYAKGVRSAIPKTLG